METLLEADVDVRDVEQQGDHIVVTTEPTALHQAIQALRDSGVEEFNQTAIEMIPQSEITLEGEDLENFEKLIDVLEDDEDVQNVYHNVEL